MSRDVTALLRVARQVIANGNHGGALPLLQEAVRLAPDSCDGHGLLGVCLWTSGRRDEGLCELQRSVDLNPRSDEAHYNLGVMLQEGDRLEEAARHFEVALTLRPAYQRAADALREVQATLTQEQPAGAVAQQPVGPATGPRGARDVVAVPAADAAPGSEQPASGWYDTLVQALQTSGLPEAPEQPTDETGQPDAPK